MLNEIEQFAADMEQAAEHSLRVRFNPLAFTMEEVNEMMRKGYEPLPHSMWYLPEERKQEQIRNGERKPT